MLYDKLDPIEYLEFVAGLWSLEGRRAERLAEELLESLDLWPHRRERCEGLSSGMKQKLALAGAFIPEPRLLMLDEPLTGLDAAAARQVKDILTARVRAGATIIMTTHILEVAERLASRIGIIARGRMIAEGTLEQLRGVIGTDGATKVALTTPSSIDLTGMSIVRPPLDANAARSWCHVAELGGAGARSGPRSCPEPKPMEENLVHLKFGSNAAGGFSRRRMLQLGGSVAGASLIPGLMGQVGRAYADDKPPIGTWPAGSQGDTVTIGATVPRTGAYAVQGEDELKGMQLAVEHLNEGNDLIKQIAPKLTKGVLGKQVALVVADSAAKPNEAVQEQQVFINDNKVIALTGSTSSAVAVALNKFAEREKILYLVAISGSNDTTGKDCTRYSFRQCFYGETAANAIGPVLVKNFGKGKKAAFMTPDYTYGHTVTKSVNDYLSSQGGWSMVTNQVSPLGTQDFSQYLTNIANSGAEFIINVNWGRDAVLSVQQAKQFGLTPKMNMVIPYQIPFLAKEVGPELTEGVFAATDFWWTLEDKYPLAKMFVDAFQKKYDYRPEWGAENAYMQFAIWGRMVSEAGSFYPPDVIKQYEKGETFPSLVGDVRFRPEDHQLIRPVIIVRGKAPKDMKNPEDFWEVLEVVPGEPLMQKPDAFGCKLGDYT